MLLLYCALPTSLIAICELIVYIYYRQQQIFQFNLNWPMASCVWCWRRLNVCQMKVRSFLLLPLFLRGARRIVNVKFNVFFFLSSCLLFLRWKRELYLAMWMMCFSCRWWIIYESNFGIFMIRCRKCTAIEKDVSTLCNIFKFCRAFKIRRTRLSHRFIFPLVNELCTDFQP